MALLDIQIGAPFRITPRTPSSLPPHECTTLRLCRECVVMNVLHHLASDLELCCCQYACLCPQQDDAPIELSSSDEGDPAGAGGDGTAGDILALADPGDGRRRSERIRTQPASKPSQIFEVGVD
jgi:hypothetical protein